MTMAGLDAKMEPRSSFRMTMISLVEDASGFIVEDVDALRASLSSSAMVDDDGSFVADKEVVFYPQ